MGKELEQNPLSQDPRLAGIIDLDPTIWQKYIQKNLEEQPKTEEIIRLFSNLQVKKVISKKISQTTPESLVKLLQNLTTLSQKHGELVTIIYNNYPELLTRENILQLSPSSIMFWINQSRSIPLDAKEYIQTLITNEELRNKHIYEFEINDLTSLAQQNSNFAALVINNHSALFDDTTFQQLNIEQKIFWAQQDPKLWEFIIEKDSKFSAEELKELIENNDFQTTTFLAQKNQLVFNSITKNAELKTIFIKQFKNSTNKSPLSLHNMVFLLRNFPEISQQIISPKYLPVLSTANLPWTDENKLKTALKILKDPTLSDNDINWTKSKVPQIFNGLFEYVISKPQQLGSLFDNSESFEHNDNIILKLVALSNSPDSFISLFAIITSNYPKTAANLISRNTKTRELARNNIVDLIDSLRRTLSAKGTPKNQIESQVTRLLSIVSPHAPLPIGEPVTFQAPKAPAQPLDNQPILDLLVTTNDHLWEKIREQKEQVNLFSDIRSELDAAINNSRIADFVIQHKNPVITDAAEKATVANLDPVASLIIYSTPTLWNGDPCHRFGSGLWDRFRKWSGWFCKDELAQIKNDIASNSIFKMGTTLKNQNKSDNIGAITNTILFSELPADDNPNIAAKNKIQNFYDKLRLIESGLVNKTAGETFIEKLYSAKDTFESTLFSAYYFGRKNQNKPLNFYLTEFFRLFQNRCQLLSTEESVLKFISKYSFQDITLLAKHAPEIANSIVNNTKLSDALLLKLAKIISEPKLLSEDVQFWMDQKQNIFANISEHVAEFTLAGDETQKLITLHQESNHFALGFAIIAANSLATAQQLLNSPQIYKQVCSNINEIVYFLQEYLTCNKYPQDKINTQVDALLAINTEDQQLKDVFINNFDRALSVFYAKEDQEQFQPNIKTQLEKSCFIINNALWDEHIYKNILSQYFTEHSDVYDKIDNSPDQPFDERTLTSFIINLKEDENCPIPLRKKIKPFTLLNPKEPPYIMPPTAEIGIYYNSDIWNNGDPFKRLSNPWKQLWSQTGWFYQDNIKEIERDIKANPIFAIKEIFKSGNPYPHPALLIKELFSDSLVNKNIITQSEIARLAINRIRLIEAGLVNIHLVSEYIGKILAFSNNDTEIVELARYSFKKLNNDNLKKSNVNIHLDAFLHLLLASKECCDKLLQSTQITSFEKIQFLEFISFDPATLINNTVIQAFIKHLNTNISHSELAQLIGYYLDHITQNKPLDGCTQYVMKQILGIDQKEILAPRNISNFIFACFSKLSFQELTTWIKQADQKIVTSIIKEPRFTELLKEKLATTILSGNAVPLENINFWMDQNQNIDQKSDVDSKEQKDIHPNDIFSDIFEHISSRVLTSKNAEQLTVLCSKDDYFALGVAIAAAHSPEIVQHLINTDPKLSEKSYFQTYDIAYFLQQYLDLPNKDWLNPFFDNYYYNLNANDANNIQEQPDDSKKTIETLLQECDAKVRCIEPGSVDQKAYRELTEKLCSAGKDQKEDSANLNQSKHIINPKLMDFIKQRLALDQNKPKNIALEALSFQEITSLAMHVGSDQFLNQNSSLLNLLKLRLAEAITSKQAPPLRCIKFWLEKEPSIFANIFELVAKQILYYADTKEEEKDYFALGAAIIVAKSPAIFQQLITSSQQTSQDVFIQTYKIIYFLQRYLIRQNVPHDEINAIINKLFNNPCIKNGFGATFKQAIDTFRFVSEKNSFSTSHNIIMHVLHDNDIRQQQLSSDPNYFTCLANVKALPFLGPISLIHLKMAITDDVWTTLLKNQDDQNQKLKYNPIFRPNYDFKDNPIFKIRSDLETVKIDADFAEFIKNHQNPFISPEEKAQISISDLDPVTALVIVCNPTLREDFDIKLKKLGYKPEDIDKNYIFKLGTTFQFQNSPDDLSKFVKAILFSTPPENSNPNIFYEKVCLISSGLVDENTAKDFIHTLTVHEFDQFIQETFRQKASYDSKSNYLDESNFNIHFRTFMLSLLQNTNLAITYNKANDELSNIDILNLKLYLTAFAEAENVDTNLNNYVHTLLSNNIRLSEILDSTLLSLEEKRQLLCHIIISKLIPLNDLQTIIKQHKIHNEFKNLTVSLSWDIDDTISRECEIYNSENNKLIHEREFIEGEQLWINFFDYIEAQAQKVNITIKNSAITTRNYLDSLDIIINKNKKTLGPIAKLILNNDWDKINSLLNDQNQTEPTTKILREIANKLNHSFLRPIDTSSKLLKKFQCFFASYNNKQQEYNKIDLIVSKSLLYTEFSLNKEEETCKLPSKIDKCAGKDKAAQEIQKKPNISGDIWLAIDDQPALFQDIRICPCPSCIVKVPKEASKPNVSAETMRNYFNSILDKFGFDNIDQLTIENWRRQSPTSQAVNDSPAQEHKLETTTPTIIANIESKQTTPVLTAPNSAFFSQPPQSHQELPSDIQTQLPIPTISNLNSTK